MRTRYAARTYGVVISLNAGTVSTAAVGILGSVSTWGATGDSSALVLSGPGTLTRNTGALFNVSGLDAVTPTRVFIRRTLTADQNVSFYNYIETTAGANVHAGSSVTASNPSAWRLSFSASLTIQATALRQATAAVAAQLANAIGKGLAASTAPIATRVIQAAKLARAVSSAAASLIASRASGAALQAATSPLGLLVRQAAAIRRAVTAPVVGRAEAVGRAAQATTSPRASMSAGISIGLLLQALAGAVADMVVDGKRLIASAATSPLASLATSFVGRFRRRFVAYMRGRGGRAR